MKTVDFDYHLSRALIAQTPVEPRDSSKLLVYERSSGSHEHRVFRDLPAFLRPGDLLVANDTRVLPARLHGRRVPSGGRVELLLLCRKPSQERECWEVLARPARRLRTGAQIAIDTEGCSKPRLFGTVVEEVGPGHRLVEFDSDDDVVLTLLEHGVIPLPPYISQSLADPERYQTVYARCIGSAAAPTAGLHFTQPLMKRLEDEGIGIGFVTLHIGLDTFRPLDEEDLERHAMHSEFAVLSDRTAAEIRNTHLSGGRVVAVGTTVVRVLETAAGVDGEVAAFSGPTKLFVCPGYRFRTVDALVTNFHLPRSTLIVLVSAFAGRQEVLDLYKLAAESGYRFYSFGDAMLIL